MTDHIEYDEARALSALKAGAAEFWHSFVAAHPDHHIYGFGFYDSLGHGHVDVLVLTEEGLDQAVEAHRYVREEVRWSGGDSPHLLSPSNDAPVGPEVVEGMTDEERAAWYEEISGLTGDLGFPAVLGTEQIDEAWDEIVVDDDDDLWDEPVADYERRARECCLRALAELDAEGLFGERRPGLTLLFTGEDESGVRESVTRLNPPEIVARFEGEVAAREAARSAFEERSRAWFGSDEA